MKVLLESQYLPSIAYFTLLYHANEIWIEAEENFEKQSYRNRCEILGSNKIQRLTVPVHQANSGLPIQEVKIDHRQKWINIHWRAIQSAYGKAPYFDYYEEMLKHELYRTSDTLFELNKRLMTLCLKALQMSAEIKFTEKYDSEASEDILDFRSAIHPKKDIERLTWFQPKPYYQVFGKNFAPNLSIIDLLFCMGPESVMVLKSSGVFK